MKQIEQIYTINAPVDKVWQAFFDPELIDKWGAGPAKMDAAEGGKFSLWGGEISGINTKIVPNKLLEEDWYGHDHPERCYKVRFIFESVGDSTTVQLFHADVPDDEVQDFEDGWRAYYFDPIKELLEK